MKRLQASGSQLSAPAAAAARPRARQRRWLWPVIAAPVIAAAAISWYTLRPTPVPVLQFRQVTYSGQVVDAVISPDGKFLAHVENSPQGTSLHLLSLTSNSDVQIVPAGNGCCQSPSFSPDGGQVYFLQGRELEAVPVLGGAVRVIAGNACSGAGFSPDGSQIAYVAMNSGTTVSLMLARPDGSSARQLSATPTGDGYVSQCYGLLGGPTHSPAWSPAGRRIALVLGTPDRRGHIAVIDARDGTSRLVGPNVWHQATDLSWLNRSALVFTASLPPTAASEVWEMTVPGGRLTRLTNDLQGYATASLAATGALALTHSAPTASLWVSAKPGAAFQLLPGGGGDLDGSEGLAWTPSGGLVSTRTIAGDIQLWAETANGSTARPLSLAGAALGFAVPQVAPNGQIVLATANGNGIYRINSDGTGLTEIAHAPPGSSRTMDPVLIDGGRTVAYLVGTRSLQSLWTVPLAGGTPRQLWTGFVHDYGNPASPDGRRIFTWQLPPGSPDGFRAVILSLGAGRVQVTPLAMQFNASMFPFGWTSDGKAVTFIRRTGSVDNIWALPVSPAGAGKPYAVTHFTDMSISAYAFGPGGRLAVSRRSPNTDAVLATGLARKP
ncbi:MAG: TolB family protein [Terriglobales bacterium]